MRRSRIVLALLAGALAAALLGCGKKGPPLPPLEGSVPRVADLEARQVGSSVVATFTLPLRPGMEIVDYQLRGIELWRRPVPEPEPEPVPAAELPAPEAGVAGEPTGEPAAATAAATGAAQPGAPAQPTAATATATPAARPASAARPGEEPEPPPVKQFTEGSVLAASVSGEDLFRLLARPRLELVDRFAGGAPEGTVEYGLVMRTDVRRAGTVSNLVAVTLVPPPAAPANVRATPVEAGIELAWEGAGSGANVYRAIGAEALGVEPIHEAPASSPFVDDDVTPGVAYRYLVRAVATVDAVTLESDAGPEVTATWSDTFPPAAPKGLRVIAATARGVDLVWNPSVEPDLGGYHVYRRVPGAEWARLDAAGVPGATFADTSVAAGATYEYAVTAHDRAEPPNESARSEPVTARVEGGAGAPP